MLIRPWLAVVGAVALCSHEIRAEQKPSTVAKGSVGSDEPVGGKALARPTEPLTPSVVGFGPSIFFEDSTRFENRTQNGNETEELREDHVSDGVYNLQAWVLFPVLNERVRFGGGLAWYNKYTLAYPEEENNNRDETYVIGHTFDLFAQLEYVIPDIVSDLGVLLALKGGAVIAFASGELREDLDRHDRSGFNVWPLPRFGGFVGPHLGLLWPLNDKLTARFGAGAEFSKLVLWSVKAEDGGTLTELDAHLNTTRYLFSLGLEIGL